MQEKACNHFCFVFAEDQKTPMKLNAEFIGIKHTFYRFITAILRIKKTETPIFQGISVVLPKVYLGGRDDRSLTDKQGFILS